MKEKRVVRYRRGFFGGVAAGFVLAEAGVAAGVAAGFAGAVAPLPVPVVVPEGVPVAGVPEVVVEVGVGGNEVKGVGSGGSGFERMPATTASTPVSG